MAPEVSQNQSICSWLPERKVTAFKDRRSHTLSTVRETEVRPWRYPFEVINSTCYTRPTLRPTRRTPPLRPWPGLKSTRITEWLAEILIPVFVTQLLLMPRFTTFWIFCTLRVVNSHVCVVYLVSTITTAFPSNAALMLYTKCFHPISIVIFQLNPWDVLRSTSLWTTCGHRGACG